MLYDSAVSIVRTLGRELSVFSVVGRSAHLNLDEMSDHMLRDLGLLDGNSRASAEPPRHAADFAGQHVHDALTPRAL